MCGYRCYPKLVGKWTEWSAESNEDPRTEKGCQPSNNLSDISQCLRKCNLILLTAGGAVALWFVRSFRIKQSGFKSWPRTLCCVVGQHTLLLRCLSPPRCINLTLACDLILVPAKGFFRKVVVYYVLFLFAMHLLKILNTIICTAQVLLLCVKSCLPPWHNYSEIDDILLPIKTKIDRS